MRKGKQKRKKWAFFFFTHKIVGAGPRGLLHTFHTLLFCWLTLSVQGSS